MTLEEFMKKADQLAHDKRNYNKLNNAKDEINDAIDRPERTKITIYERTVEVDTDVLLNFLDGEINTNKIFISSLESQLGVDHEI